MHFGTVFNDPIVARDPAVQIAMFDVSTYFLGANESNFHLLVINIGQIGSTADFDIVAGLGEFLEGRFLKASLGKSQFQNVFLLVFDFILSHAGGVHWSDIACASEGKKAGVVETTYVITPKRG